MDKIIAIWNRITKNPVDFLKFMIFSLDHTERGASIKKIIGSAIALCIVFAHYVWYKCQASKGDLTNLMPILWFDGALLGALLGFNLIQEAHAANLKNDK